MREHVLVVQYPIFLKCCQYLTDPFWVYLFEDMAYGRCPYGILIQDQCMYCILRSREFTYPLQQDKSPEEVAKELCHILSTRLQLLSQQDHFRYRNECHDHTKTYMDSITSWNDIRKKNLKDILLEKFSLAQKAKYRYSHQLTHTLFAILFIGLQFKTILHRQIEYHDHAIQHIDGIACQPKRIVCAYNVFVTKLIAPHATATTIKHRPTSVRMSDAWKRYLLSFS